MFLRVLCLILLRSRLGSGYTNLASDPCPNTSYRSHCQLIEECPQLQELFKSGQLTLRTVENCGFSTGSEKICCPLNLNKRLSEMPVAGSSTASTTQRTTTTTTTATTARATTTITMQPFWLNLFNTKQEYLNNLNADTRTVASDSSTVATESPTGSDNNNVNSNTERNNSNKLAHETLLLQTGSSSFAYPGRISNSVNATCQAPLYTGTCLATSDCSIVFQLLEEQRLKSDDVPSCGTGIKEEIICCPNVIPIQPRGDKSISYDFMRFGGTETNGTQMPPINATESTAEVTPAAKLLPHYTHLAALAYYNERQDGFVHRCTAVVLLPQLLLAAAACAPANINRPSHAVFGVSDLADVDVDVDNREEITKIFRLRNDLALLELDRPLKLQEFNVSLAPLCTFFDILRLLTFGKLIATAWAKGNGTDCPLYEQSMQLLPHDQCANISNANQVTDLGQGHLCVGPKLGEPQQPITEGCSYCPSGVGSVLHMLRPNGTSCVVGVATPTGDKCDTKQLYYTSLLDPNFSDRIKSIIDDQRQEH